MEFEVLVVSAENTDEADNTEDEDDGGDYNEDKESNSAGCHEFTWRWGLGGFGGRVELNGGAGEDGDDWEMHFVSLVW